MELDRDRSGLLWNETTVRDTAVRDTAISFGEQNDALVANIHRGYNYWKGDVSQDVTRIQLLTRPSSPESKPEIVFERDVVQRELAIDSDNDRIIPFFRLRVALAKTQARRRAKLMQSYEY